MSISSQFLLCLTWSCPLVTGPTITVSHCANVETKQQPISILSHKMFCTWMWYSQCSLWHGPRCARVFILSESPSCTTSTRRLYTTHIAGLYGFIWGAHEEFFIRQWKIEKRWKRHLIKFEECAWSMDVGMCAREVAFCAFDCYRISIEVRFMVYTSHIYTATAGLQPTGDGKTKQRCLQGCVAEWQYAIYVHAEASASNESDTREHRTPDDDETKTKQYNKGWWRFE